MTTQSEVKQPDGCHITIAPGVDREIWLGRMGSLESFLAGAERVHSSHSALIDRVRVDGLALAVKHFPGRSRWKRGSDRFQGTPASRAFEAARLLEERGVRTATPIACVEDRERVGGGLLITEWLEDHLSFKDALIELYTRGAECPQIMALLQAVALAVRAMHDAGIFHRDLGNQNIMLQRDGAGYGHPCLIDLNRARVLPEVTLRQRAFDLSRIHLPSDFLRIFVEMYFDARAPKPFRRAEQGYRRRFAWHTASRKYRHPLRTWRQRGQNASDYPAPRELWVWDPCSAQAIATLRGAERHRLQNKGDWWCMAVESIRHAAAVRRQARELCRTAFCAPVPLQGRVGLAISENPAVSDYEDECLTQLPGVHVLARFYAHETETEWAALAERLHRLHSAGHALSIVLVQDRQAVREPERWRLFVRTVLEAVGTIVDDVQVGQAINRTKWGIWSFREYARLIEVAAQEAKRCPGLTLLGPAIIDYEPHYLLGALKKLPHDVHLGGVGHLLYVDRRGAPENRQGRHATLEKLAVIRAIAQLSPHTDDRLIISETNWPLAGTGIWSPTCSPYLFSGQTVEGGVDEMTYGHYMIRYLLIALCSGLAERVCWWRLCAHGFGLVDDRGPEAPRKRPAYTMLRQFLVRVQHATFTGCPATPEGVHAFRFESPECGTFHIAYAEAGARERGVALNSDRVEDACGVVLSDYDGLAPASGAPIYLFSS